MCLFGCSFMFVCVCLFWATKAHRQMFQVPVFAHRSILNAAKQMVIIRSNVVIQNKKYNHFLYRNHHNHLNVSKRWPILCTHYNNIVLSNKSKASINIYTHLNSDDHFDCLWHFFLSIFTIHSSTFTLSQGLKCSIALCVCVCLSASG